MHLRVGREHGDPLIEAATELLRQEPLLAYKSFAPIAEREGALQDLHLGWWRTAAAAVVVRDERDRPLAALRYSRRDFESQHFGLTMAKIDAPLAVADDATRLAALRLAYREVGEILREEGYHHTSAVASTNDRLACWALQEVGAFYVGTKISWMQPLTGERQPHRLAPHLRIEAYDRSTIDRLPPATWRRLLDWCGGAFDRGPHVFDLNVPYDRAQQIYQVWTEKALRGEWADTLIVVRDGDEVVSFHSMMTLPDLSKAAGVGIVGRGIGASLPGYPGLFTALQKECAAIRPQGAGFLENETQASTIQSIQVFGKLGHRCIGSAASFHKSLIDASPR